MNVKLKLAKDFSMPIDATTQTFAILAKRGVGKTHNASVMAEEMLKADQQIVAIDPTGAWWGLRSGYPVVIFGGEHADVPLEDGAGEVIAQAIVDGRISAVIDTSLFRKGQQRRFLISFLETLYRLNRAAVHLFVDEADDVCPQKPFGDEAQLVGALEDVVKRGRKKGIGCSLITQRPAALNKDVLTQCEILVAMRLLHPLDIKAIKEWVNVHADPVVADEMIKSLPTLEIGVAWFWAPGWGNIFQRVKVRRRETFDSSSTPKPGEKAAVPKSLKEIDLEALGEQIKATVKNAKENAPETLKRRIRELEQSRSRSTSPAELERARQAGVSEGAKKSANEARIYRRLWQEAEQIILRLKAHVASIEIPEEPATPPLLAPVPRESHVVTIQHKVSPHAPSSNGEIKIGGQRIIATISMLNRRGLPVNRESIARWMGIHPNGGRYNHDLAELRASGQINGFLLTRPVDAVEAPLPSGPDGVLRALPDESMRNVFAEILNSGAAKELSREELAGILNIHPNGGRYNRTLAWLRTMGVIPERGLIKPTEGVYR